LVDLRERGEQPGPTPVVAEHRVVSRSRLSFGAELRAWLREHAASAR
jgi:hypothetical protein